MARADPCPEFRPLANIDKRHLVFDGDTFRQDPAYCDDARLGRSSVPDSTSKFLDGKTIRTAMMRRLQVPGYLGV